MRDRVHVLDRGCVMVVHWIPTRAGRLQYTTSQLKILTVPSQSVQAMLKTDKPVGLEEKDPSTVADQMDVPRQAGWMPRDGPGEHAEMGWTDASRWSWRAFQDRTDGCLE